MGTSNFYNKNASKIFAVTLQDELSYDDTLVNLHYDFKDFKDFYSLDEYDNERSFSGKYFGRFRAYFENVNTVLTLDINLIVRSGYYEHCNLDFDVELEIDNQELCGDSLDNIDDILSYDLNNYKASTIGEQMKAYLKQRIKLIESIYKGYSTPLEVAARFSNGETIYKKENQSQEQAINNYIN